MAQDQDAASVHRRAAFAEGGQGPRCVGVVARERGAVRHDRVHGTDVPCGGVDLVEIREDGDFVGDRDADPADAGERADAAHGTFHVLHLERHVCEVEPQVLERGVMNGG